MQEKKVFAIKAYQYGFDKDGVEVSKPFWLTSEGTFAPTRGMCRRFHRFSEASLELSKIVDRAHKNQDVEKEWFQLVLEARVTTWVVRDARKVER